MEQKKRVIALGFFDGVHNGHGALMRRTAQVAQELGAVPSAFTFDPQTVILGRPMPLLTSPEDRADLMRKYYGIQDVIVEPFTVPRMKQPWQDFVASTLVKDLHAVHLVAGHDYHFGYKGEGNPQRLQQICQELGIGCDIIPKVEMEGITVSSTYIRTLVDSIVSDQLSVYLEEHPMVARTILDKAMTANRAREAARKARESIRRKTVLGGAAMPDKLRDCNENNPELTELYIVEGDSAGGSATAGRDSRFQAILPLWGKMLNVEKARVDKVYGNDKLQPVIIALGAGIGEEFDENKLRYHKIIIMADADVDGAHIRTLLLTFFFRQYQEMVEKGYVYIAQPPLYRVHNARMEKFIKDDAELNEFLLNRVSEDVTVVAANGREYTGRDLIRLMETIEKIELRVADAESTGMPRPLFLALATYPRAVDRALLEARDADFLSWLEKHEYALSLEREHSEDEDEGRVFAVFENTGSHHTRRGMEFFASRLYRQTWQLFNDLREQCGELSFSLRRKDSSSQAGDVFDLMQMTLDEARKGINIQRYKGLGEMNPEQLWVTTMNPENRVLLQVSVEDANEASDAFEELMGDRVEPRREFIERNALSVQDLDI